MKLRFNPSQTAQQQRGVALISVLLIFAIAAALAARMMSQGSLQTQEVSVYLQQQQLRTYSRSVESYALTLLQTDWLQDTENSTGDEQNSTAYDHVSEAWAKAYRFPLDQMQSGRWSDIGFDQARGFTAEQDETRLKIIALDGYFNVNNLLSEQGDHIDPHNLAALRHLLAQKQIPEAVADLLADWVDSNNDPISLFGAEDNQYLLLQPPYRSAGQHLHNLSETFLLSQIEPKTLSPLYSVAVALPKQSVLNVNLVLPEVMAAVFNTNSEQAKRWLLERDTNPITQLTEFFAAQRLKTEWIKQFSTRSQYFQINIKVQIEAQNAYLRTVVYRDLKTGVMQVISRNFQPFADQLLNEEVLAKGV